MGSLWLDRTLVGCAVVALGYLLLQIVLFRYGRDQGIYAVVAEVMVRGGAPYRDAWDFKPPGIFAVYALARLLLGPDEHGVRVLEAVGFASLVGAFMIVSRRWIGEGKAGLLGGVLAVGTQAQLEFWHTGQPESFGAVLLAWALVCATHEPSGDRARHKEIALWVGCGALYAAAAMLKPPLGGGFLVSLMVVGARVYRRESGGKVRALALVVGAFSLGGSLVVGGVTLYFVAKGALGDLYQTLFVFTPHYTKLGFRSEWFWGFVYLAFEQWFVGFSALLGVGLLLWLGLPSFGRREREGALHVMGVVTFQLVGIALQAKFFPYHYGAALPFGALLAGWGFWKLWLRVRRDMAYVLLFGLLIYLLAGARGASRDLTDTFWARSKMRLTALLHPERRDELEDYLHTVADVNAGANRQVAAWLRLHTGDDTTIFIWGFEPEIYHLARRRPASRYIYNVPQRVSWSTDESRRVLMEELHRAKPQAFVVEHRDVFPHVTGNRDDSAAALRSFSELDEFLKENYRYVLSMEDFDIYVRR
ncbi:MAG: hypothetical protein NZX77_22265 [Polyangiaceae bacterium]|nr:hypothetical protein [Polyangiaceae bacterium]